MESQLSNGSRELSDALRCKVGGGADWRLKWGRWPGPGSRTVEGERTHSCDLGSLPRIERAPRARASQGTEGTFALVARTPGTMDQLPWDGYACVEDVVGFRARTVLNVQLRASLNFYCH